MLQSEIRVISYSKVSLNPIPTGDGNTYNFSAPNPRTDMKNCVYDPNISKNKWKFFQLFSLLKIGR